MIKYKLNIAKKRMKKMKMMMLNLNPRIKLKQYLKNLLKVTMIIIQAEPPPKKKVASAENKLVAATEKPKRFLLVKKLKKEKEKVIRSQKKTLKIYLEISETPKINLSKNTDIQ